MTYKITTDFAGTESLATTKTRLESILDFWLGSGSTSSVSAWGDIRTLLNTVAPAAITIADGELASSFRTKLNTLNSTDGVVTNLLFNADEPGVWYDPSDLDTLFQDTAGTTPVTTPGQTVGLMLDKSGNDFHATQATAAARPTYGIVPETGRRNLLTYTEEFDNAAWIKGQTTVSASVAVAPDGTATSDKLVENTATAQHAIRQTVTATSNTVATFSFHAKAGERSVISVRFGSATLANRAQLNVDLSTGTAGDTLNVGTATDTTAFVESAGNGWYRVSISTNPNDAASGSLRGDIILSNQTLLGPNGPSYTGDGTSGIYIWGAQLELGSTATAYQKVTTQFDVTEAGVPSLGYLSFDGVDDFMVTPTITPGTDKAQVFAGVRKLSDALAVPLELSPSSSLNTGTLAVISASGYDFRSKGTLVADADAPSTLAPTTNVLTGLGDISGDTSTIRINGVQESQNTGNQGTGNYLAYPLYIGRRGGTSLPFNGHVYSLITRFGPNLSSDVIGRAETYTAQKTGVTL